MKFHFIKFTYLRFPQAFVEFHRNHSILITAYSLFSLDCYWNHNVNCRWLNNNNNSQHVCWSWAGWWSWFVKREIDKLIHAVIRQTENLSSNYTFGGCMLWRITTMCTLKGMTARPNNNTNRRKTLNNNISLAVLRYIQIRNSFRSRASAR